MSTLENAIAEWFARHGWVIETEDNGDVVAFKPGSAVVNLSELCRAVREAED